MESIYWRLMGDTTTCPTEHVRMYGESMDDFPNPSGRVSAESLRALNARGINPFVTAMAYAHSLDLKFYVYQRMGPDTFYPPHEMDSTGDFYGAHPEFRCVS